MFCCRCSSYYRHEQPLSFQVPIRALSATGPNMHDVQSIDSEVESP